MKSRCAGLKRYPKLYQHFRSADEIGKVINRSQSYVFKALKVGFTERETVLLDERITNDKGG